MVRKGWGRKKAQKARKGRAVVSCIESDPHFQDEEDTRRHAARLGVRREASAPRRFRRGFRVETVVASAQASLLERASPKRCRAYACHRTPRCRSAIHARPPESSDFCRWHEPQKDAKGAKRIAHIFRAFCAFLRLKKFPRRALRFTLRPSRRARRGSFSAGCGGREAGTSCLCIRGRARPSGRSW